jgi:hypothetical protein
MTSAQPAPVDIDHLRRLIGPQEFQRAGRGADHVRRRPDERHLGEGLIRLGSKDPHVDLDTGSDDPATHHMVEKIRRYAQPFPALHCTHPGLMVEQPSCPKVVQTHYYNIEYQLSRFLSVKIRKIQSQNSGVCVNRGILPPPEPNAASCFIIQRNSGGSRAGGARQTVPPPAPQHGRHHGAERLPRIQFRWRDYRACGRTFQPPSSPASGRALSLELQNDSHRKSHELSLQRWRADGSLSRGNSNTGQDAWSAPIRGQISRGTA